MEEPDTFRRMTPGTWAVPGLLARPHVPLHSTGRLRQLGRRLLRREDRPIVAVARNVSSRYVAILVDTVIGLAMLPFNVAHLGPSAYGLWMLTASLTVHFSVLDLGYAGSLVKFVAQYRAHRDTRALNEIASTLFFVFAAVGCVAYGVAAALAFNLDALFTLTAEQAATGRWVLLAIGVHVALNFPFSVYGGVVSGFQRYDVNSVVAVASSIAVALVNVAVLLSGYGLVALVLATTSVRVLTYFVYRRTAIGIYPALRISPNLFRRARLREVTGFSVYASMIDWAHKLNYQIDQLVIGVFLGPAPVAVWAVADRIIHATQRLTNQLNGVLFPMVVDSHTTLRRHRLQQILQQGTLLSLAMVIPVAAALVLLAEPLVRVWVRRPELMGSVPIIQILAVVVAVRVGAATSTTLLKGAGSHRMLAWVNMATAAVNIALSVALIGPYGLPGVAVGTLVPVALSSMLIVFPAACARAGLPLGQAVRHSVLPALWPAAIVLSAGLLARDAFPSASLLSVAVQAGAGVVLYLAIFFRLAIGGADRALYVSKLRELTGRRASSFGLPRARGGAAPVARPDAQAAADTLTVR